MNLLNDVIKAGGDFWAVKLAIFIEKVSESEGDTTIVFAPNEHEEIIIQRKNGVYAVSDVLISDNITTGEIIGAARILYMRYLDDTITKIYLSGNKLGYKTLMDRWGRHIRTYVIGQFRNRLVIRDKVIKFNKVEDLYSTLESCVDEAYPINFKYDLISTIIRNGRKFSDNFNESLFPNWYDVNIVDEEYSGYDIITISGNEYERSRLAAEISLYGEGKQSDCPISRMEIDELFEAVTKSIPTNREELKGFYITAINIANREIGESEEMIEELSAYHVPNNGGK